MPQTVLSRARAGHACLGRVPPAHHAHTDLIEIGTERESTGRGKGVGVGGR